MKVRYADEPNVKPGEIGKVLEVYFNYDYGDEARDLMRELPWNVANHTCLDYPRLVKIGYDGVREQVREALREHPEREIFYTAMLISLDAASKYIHDYADAAREAAKTATPERAAELNELGRVCDKIADKKPDTFFEAMQLVWMTHLIGNVDGGSAMSLGRFDQYMRPFFEKDYADGTLTLDRARELIAALWLKLNEPKMRTVQSCCLGGVTRDGKDGASLLTRLCLEITALLKLPYPNTSVRVNDEISPDWLLDECIRTIKAGGGMPMILNDRLWVKNFNEIVRLPIEDARDFYNMGCVEMLIQSKQPNWAGGGGVDLPRLVLEEIEKKKDGDPGTFDEFMDDIVAEIHRRMQGRADDIHRHLTSEKTSCDPFASALVEGCIESGRDFFNGGTALGPFVSFGCGGLGTATDSLLAIRKHVFEDHDLTLAQISDALKANYEGYEDVRTLMQDRLSYGNDDDSADLVAKQMFDAAMADVKEYNKLDVRERFITSLFSYNSHISGGESLGATPDGRHYGDPISDCLSPVQGRDTCGPTATLNSLLKLDMRGITGAHAMNMKINGTLLKDQAGTDALKSLIQAYIADDGPQIQVNFVNAEDLIAAQKEPEKHRDLVVRIAGYCEYFVNLDRKLQSEIISRTLHELAG